MFRDSITSELENTTSAARHVRYCKLPGAPACIFRGLGNDSDVRMIKVSAPSILQECREAVALVCCRRQV